MTKPVSVKAGTPGNLRKVTVGVYLDTWESSVKERLPRSCVVRQRVEAALASGLEGNERPDVELWLEGYRRLTPTMLALPDLDGLEIRVRKPLRAANQRLMDYLGVSVVVDESAPPNYSFGDVIGNRQLRLTEMAGRR